MCSCPFVVVEKRRGKGVRFEVAPASLPAFGEARAGKDAGATSERDFQNLAEVFQQCFGAAPDMEFLIHELQVAAHGLDGEAGVIGDFLHAAALGEQAENFLLTRAEGFEAGLGGAKGDGGGGGGG